MSAEERVWKALDKPRNIQQVWIAVNKGVSMSDDMSWERVEEVLRYWLSTGKVYVTNRRFWRHPNTQAHTIHVSNVKA